MSRRGVLLLLVTGPARPSASSSPSPPPPIEHLLDFFFFLDRDTENNTFLQLQSLFLFLLLPLPQNNNRNSRAAQEGRELAYHLMMGRDGEEDTGCKEERGQQQGQQSLINHGQIITLQPNGQLSSERGLQWNCPEAGQREMWLMLCCCRRQCFHVQLYILVTVGNSSHLQNSES